MPTVLSVRLFGGMEVAIGRKRVLHFGYDKVRALLAYLLVEPPTPHNRDVLATTFWPEHSEEAARHSLRQALTELRSAFGDTGLAASLLLTTRTSVQRNPRAPLETDVALFEASVNGDASDIEKLKTAVETYRGELLRGLALANTEFFSEWLQVKREHYQSRAMTALDRLVRHFAEAGDYETGCRYARQLLSLEPWREDMHRRLMLMLARSGNRSAALEQYELCRRHLLDSLDVQPEPETERLHRKIRQMGPLESNLPAPLTPFLGRHAELTLLRGFLSEPTRRLVTITGLGGAGKSRLVIEFGAQMAGGISRRFLHGVVFVPLASVQSMDHLVAAIARSLGLVLAPGSPAQPQLTGFLQERELLLILDNFEHLISRDSLELVSRLLDSAPEVRLLVTSRQALDLQGEQRLPLVGLPVPMDLSPRGIQSVSGPEGSAIHLFVSAVRRRRPDLRFSTEDMKLVVRICRAVEGMPLAIELMAAWVESLPLEEIHARIRQHFDLLESTCPNLPERHRSLRAVFDASWGHLGNAEQMALAGLSVFSGGFTREAARRVAGADDGVLARIANHSLIEPDPHQRRYHLHELLRQFAGERMSDEATTATLDRHCDYYCRRLQELEKDLRAGQEEAALREMDDDFDNVRRAWHWALDHNKTGAVDTAVAGLHQYLTRRARYNEAAGLFARVHESLGRHRSRQGKRVLARVLAYQGDVLAEIGRRELAAQQLRECLRLLENPVLAGEDLRREQALALFRLAWLTDDAAQALPFHERSLALYREVGDPSQVASVLAALAGLFKSAGQLEKAESCIEEGLALRRTLRSPGLAAELSYGLGELRSRQGRFEQSLRAFREGLGLARAAKDPAREVRGHVSMSTACLYIGRFKQAEGVLNRAIGRQLELGCLAQSAEAQFLLGWSLVHQGRYVEGRRCGERMLEELADRGQQPYHALGLSLVGFAMLGQREMGKARDALVRGVEQLSVGWQADWHGRRSVVQAVLACSLCHLDDLQAAREQLSSAIRTALDVRSLIGVLMFLPAAALFRSKAGNRRIAEAIYTLACSQPCVANSVWTDDVVGSALRRRPRQDSAKSRLRRRSPVPVGRLWQTARQLARELS